VVVGIAWFRCHTGIVRAWRRFAGSVWPPLFPRFPGHVLDSYILTLVKCMEEQKKQSPGSVLAKHACRHHPRLLRLAVAYARSLPVREAQVSHQELVNTVSTMAAGAGDELRVPQPLSTTSKRSTCSRATWSSRQADGGAGRRAARARLASAESGVKAAQAAVEAVTQRTQQERQMSAGDWPGRLERIRRAAIWMRSSS